MGDHLLRLLIRDRRVNYIAAPTRRPLADISGVFNPHDPQLTDALAQVQDPIDIAFCCLGTTRREAGSKGVCSCRLYAGGRYGADGEKAGCHPFCGGQLAGRQRPFAVLYSKVKGEMEEALIAQKWERLTIVRPSMLLGHRDERRFNESMFAPLFRILPGNWKSIEARDVARAMLKGAVTIAGGSEYHPFGETA